eukprot:1777193-Alexandrium_andersonii.AAC.1
MPCGSVSGHGSAPSSRAPLWLTLLRPPDPGARAVGGPPADPQSVWGVPPLRPGGSFGGTPSRL